MTSGVGASDAIMNLSDDSAALTRLEIILADALGATTVSIAALSLLSGGAIQENWAADLEVTDGEYAGSLAAVLRTDSPTGVAVSHSRAQEYALLEAAWTAGVTVPEPLACVTDPAVIGKDFCLMRRVDGTAIGQKITRDPKWGGDRVALAERLGRELARIHSINPETHRFDFLAPPPADAAEAELDAMMSHYDGLDDPRPALDWAFRWLDARRPAPGEIVLAHHDYRTGNYMVDEKGLTAVLDWEFAGWSDPMEDVGWFCAMCWRFAARNRAAGGIGERDDFYRGYTAESGREIDPDRVFYWEVYAHLRWAVIALQQGARYRVGGERTLDLGLTGRRPVEMELEILRMTAPSGLGGAA